MHRCHRCDNAATRTGRHSGCHGAAWRTPGSGKVTPGLWARAPRPLQATCQVAARDVMAGGQAAARMVEERRSSPRRVLGTGASMALRAALLSAMKEATGAAAPARGAGLQSLRRGRVCAEAHLRAMNNSPCDLVEPVGSGCVFSVRAGGCNDTLGSRTACVA